MFLRRMEAQGLTVQVAYTDLWDMPETQVDVWDWFTRGEMRGKLMQQTQGVSSV